jgi:enoyl-CoA hydratase/carnithine racemase
LELNNPKALHALSFDMIQCFQDVLGEWHKDDTLKAILMKASQAKRPAFCSGGDVKKVYEAGVSGGSQHGKGLPRLATSEFFRQEYKVNHAIATWERPQISLWDGVVMGGGVGISIHGKYRISTENTLFSMPETAIGLFPDVGSMYWMSHMLMPSMARYLALTGARLRAPDLLYIGLATHHVSSKRLGELQEALVAATSSSEETGTAPDVVAPVLMSFHQIPPQDPQHSFLAEHRRSIDAAFKASHKVEDIIEALAELDNSFSRDTLEVIRKMSPTSLKVTLEGLKRGGNMGSIGEDLQMEYRMSQAFMREGSDFYQGIRATLIDKVGDPPQWSPSTLEEVTDDMVEEYFRPLGEHEWTIPSNTSNL